MPLISVIVCVYNTELYLSQCLESILNQTFRDFELIIVDDGSSDKSGEICDSYGEKDQRIKIIHKENGGIVRARKDGILNSIGDYITFVDSDDFLGKDRLMAFVKEIRVNHSDMIYCYYTFYKNAEFTRYRSELSQGFYSGEDLKKVFHKSPMDENRKYGIAPAIWAKAIKRELLINNLSKIENDITIGDDLCFASACFNDISSLSIIENYDYFYRIFESSMTNSYKKDYFNKISSLYECLTSINKTLQINYGPYFVSIFFSFIRNELYHKQNSNKSLKASIDMMAEKLQVKKLLKQNKYFSVTKEEKLFCCYVKTNFFPVLLLLRKLK